MDIYTNIANVHIKAAIKAHCNAFSHNVGLTLSSCINTKLAGIAQLFKLSTNSLAVAAVNDPSI
jgi:antitoxin component of RelBE/YafQ-DinJ toxin-antitoxin module